MNAVYVLIVNCTHFPLSGIGDWEGSWTLYDVAVREYDKRKCDPTERKYLVRIDSTGFEVVRSTL